MSGSEPRGIAESRVWLFGRPKGCIGITLGNAQGFTWVHPDFSRATLMVSGRPIGAENLGMPKDGIMRLAVALSAIGCGATEVCAACDGQPGCRGYGAYAPPPIAYAPPPVYGYYPPPGAYPGVIVGYRYYLNPRYVFRQRLLLRSPL